MIIVVYNGMRSSVCLLCWWYDLYIGGLDLLWSGFYRCKLYWCCVGGSYVLWICFYWIVVRFVLEVRILIKLRYIFFINDVFGLYVKWIIFFVFFDNNVRFIYCFLIDIYVEVVKNKWRYWKKFFCCLVFFLFNYIWILK